MSGMPFHRFQHSLKAGLLALPMLGLALAPIVAEPLGEAEIRALFSDNTVTGYSTEGRYFSEFHKADGQLFGDNGFYQNTDACWTTKPSEVCYYYGQEDARTVHCFKIDKSGEVLTMTLAPPSLRAGTIDATARVEKGNPHNHNDGGHPWFCDGLISRIGPARRFAGIDARR